MTTYVYSAVDAGGKAAQGAMEAANQQEALERIRDMGFFPMKLTEKTPPASPAERARRHANRLALRSHAATRSAPLRRVRIKAARLATFTRQLATLQEAGLPLLRGLRLLIEQEDDHRFKPVLEGLAAGIESGASFSEALSQYPAIFNRLYVNMAKAGELSGALDVTLDRLATFMEKSGRIRGKVKAALFYPAAVMSAAFGVMALMLLYIIPQFQKVFSDLTGSKRLPPFTELVMGFSDAVRHHFLFGAGLLVALIIAFRFAIETTAGRRWFDAAKLKMPVVGPVIRKLAVARFTRTLGTLVSNGVPILQALAIVRDTAGNVILRGLAEKVRLSVEEGESIAGPLRGSRVFPAMVVGMVEVGEQTGALPEMLNKVADNYEEEADNAVTALTSLLEPLLIIFLAVVVGTVVIAMFLPIITFVSGGIPDSGAGTPID